MDTTRELPDQVVGDDMATINLAELLATGRQLQQLSEQFGRLVRHAVEQQARAPAAVAWMRPQDLARLRDGPYVCRVWPWSHRPPESVPLFLAGHSEYQSGYSQALNDALRNGMQWAIDQLEVPANRWEAL